MFHCMDVTCDPGMGQLAGISVGVLQKLLCRVINEGVWAVCTVNENRNLRIKFQAGPFNINDCTLCELGESSVLREEIIPCWSPNSTVSFLLFFLSVGSCCDS